MEFFNANGKFIASGHGLAVPRVGEILQTKNRSYNVVKVVHVYESIGSEGNAVFSHKKPHVFLESLEK